MRRVFLAAVAPLLLAAHTLAFSATVDFSGLDTWRRLWSDLALATTAWIEAAHGPAPQDVVARGPAAESWAREMIVRSIDRDGLRPTRPLGTLREKPFVRERLAPEAKPYDDKGRATLLGLAFRLRGGIAPFLILWLGWLAAAPVLAWLALELGAAGYAPAAAVFGVLLALSPFVVETLALGRYAVGFYLVALLLVLPLATYARLHPSPTGSGLAVRAAVAALTLALCLSCRSSATLLVPGFLLACWLGLRRIVPRRAPRLAWLAVAAVLFTLPPAIVGNKEHHDTWQPVWEGLGDFDREKGHVWSDNEALLAARRAGAQALWTPGSEAAFRDLVLRDVATDPAWFAGILARRLAATVTMWKLWPWGPTSGTFLRRSTTANEGFIDKYWTYTTTVDHLGFGPARVEVPVPLLLVPAALLGVMAVRGGRCARARAELAVLACPAIGALALPVLITTTGGQETQAFGLVYLLAAAFVADLAWKGRTRDVASETPPSWKAED